jgi:hypothetical protein
MLWLWEVRRRAMVQSCEQRKRCRRYCDSEINWCRFVSVRGHTKDLQNRSVIGKQLTVTATYKIGGRPRAQDHGPETVDPT